MSRYSLTAAVFALSLNVAPQAFAAETSINASAAMGPWNGTIEMTTENGRPMAFVEVPVALSLNCPGGAVGSTLDYDFDPAAGVLDPHPATGLRLDGSASFQEVGSQTRQLTAALKPGAVYRVRVTGSCCASLDKNGACAEEGERVESVSEPIEIPPVIEAARVLDEGLHYGGLVAGQTLPLTIYDSAPEPGWSIEADNVRKFIKFKGAGVDFKSKDYRGTNSFNLTTLSPTKVGEVEATLTVKGKLYTPAGKYVRDYTLTSEAFAIPVTAAPCLLDGAEGVFITADSRLACQGGSAEEVTDEGEDIVPAGGCAGAGGAEPVGMVGWMALALLSGLRRWRR